MPDLPSGTVTFLFTDIEGSTRLWEEHPEAMRLALARHDALLRSTIERQGGHVFKTVGDAFCAAFATAPHALQAALAAQQSLHAEPWPPSSPLKVRMALHSGSAEIRDDDYFGQPLNRVARLLATGYGGQVLLSLSSAELIRDALPALVSLKALGEHQLRDLAHPETVFQLLHPDLPAEFPPLKSFHYLPNNLPRQLTSFIGRESLIEEVRFLLTKSSLLTLTGTGGSGKTRLALRVAEEMGELFPDGVWLVELAPLTDPALVPKAVAQVLEVREQANQSLLQTLTDKLKSKCLLLILDNCEHLLPACAQLSDALLRTCRHVKILASSREGLGISGEMSVRVPSLSLPDRTQAVTVESVHQYEALQLFIERALFHLPAFSVTPQNAPALASICRRLDGIPLAIELAAARVKSLSVEEINIRLDNCFRLLTGGSKTALPRQQTLRELINWSYELLHAQEKVLLARLSVFSGGWTLEAAEAVCSAENVEDWEVLDLLTGLVDKSLVLAEDQEGVTRYRLLETVRQYAREKLQDLGEAELVRGRHRDHYLALVQEAAPQLLGADQQRWIDRLEREHDNLRAALARCAEEEQGAEAGLQLAGALGRFWVVRGYLTEGREHLERALSREGAQTTTLARAEALNGIGNLAKDQGDYERAHMSYDKSLSIFKALGDKRGIAGSLNNLGTVAHARGDYVQARHLYAESLAIHREQGNKQGVAGALINLGLVAHLQGDYAQAYTLYEQSLAIQRELENKQGISGSLSNLGLVAHLQGDFAQAYTLYEQSLNLRRELGDRLGIANSLMNLGLVAHDQGDDRQARRWLEESLNLRRELGDRVGTASSLMNLGTLAHAQGDKEQARRWLEESLHLRRELGDKMGIAYSLINLGELTRDQGDYEQARMLFEESMNLCRELGDKRGIAGSLMNLGALFHVQGDKEQAHKLLGEGLSLSRELGDKQGIASALEGLAAVLPEEAEGQKSVRLWAAAQALRQNIGAPQSPVEQEQHQPRVARRRETMGDAAFDAAWEEGSLLTWEQAVAYALEETPFPYRDGQV